MQSASTREHAISGLPEELDDVAPWSRLGVRSILRPLVALFISSEDRRRVAYQSAKRCGSAYPLVAQIVVEHHMHALGLARETKYRREELSQFRFLVFVVEAL